MHALGCALTTNCSNNYGPYHFPEKLIPLVIHNALAGKALPIYGNGQQIRDWLYVTDHCSAIRRVLEAGRVGEVYNIGGWNEKANLEGVLTLCAMLDELQPRADGKPYQEQMTYVKIAPATTGATPLTPASWNVSWAGSLPRTLRAVSAKPSSGIWRIRTGWRM